MKDYLSLWAAGLPNQPSLRLSMPITVLGKRIRQLGTKAEFAKVQLTVHPSDTFEVADNVVERTELERLGVEWPDCLIFGLLDILMLAESGPLFTVRVVLEKVWYHEVDSSSQAFRHAGRDAGRKIVEAMRDDTYGSQIDMTPA